MEILIRLEDAVRKGDGDGLRARWESGRYMLTLKKGKQLPRGELARLAETLGVHRAELTARMKFATKFATEGELADAIRKFQTWNAITHHALTDKPRVEEGEPDQENQEGNDDAAKESGRLALLRVLAVLEGIDPATLDDDDLELVAQVAKGVHRLYTAVRTLMEVAS
jgi:hypothetical protein